MPLSLAGTFALMWVVGFSIDNISLMALAVAVGFVVDDAIVMIENVFRNLEQGMTPLRATIEGARQIGFTVISISASLIAAFIPLFFMGGVVGRLFTEFAMTLAFAIVISTVVSLYAHADDLRAFRARGAEPERHLARPRGRGRAAPHRLGLHAQPRRRAALPLADAAGVLRHHRAHRRRSTSRCRRAISRRTTPA